jgi:hypothetical protein
LSLHRDIQNPQAARVLYAVEYPKRAPSFPPRLGLASLPIKAARNQTIFHFDLKSSKKTRWI